MQNKKFSGTFFYIYSIQISLFLFKLLPIFDSVWKKMNNDTTKTFILLKYWWPYFGDTTTEFIRGQMIKYCKNNIADDDICQNVSEFPLFCYKSIIVRAFLNSVLKYIESYVNINSF